MASDGEASCVCDPNFAIICSFLEKFAKTCGITHPNFLELQEMLENTQTVAQPLIELHLKLLRKARKSVSSDRWEKALIKFCHTYSKPDGWELERFGYKKVPLSLKLRLLKGLLEVQFDLNSKFKADVNRLSSEELRLQPIGRDKLGHTYWSQLDEECNLRVYREDLDDESWEIVARDREGLFKLIGQLSSNEPFNSELDALLNEDSNSQEIENPITDTGQVSKSPNSDEDVDDEGEFEEIETGDEDDFDESDDEKEVKKAETSSDGNFVDKIKEETEKVGDSQFGTSNDIKEVKNDAPKMGKDGNSDNLDLTNKVGESLKVEVDDSGHAKQVAFEMAEDLTQPKAAHGNNESATDLSSHAKQSSVPENAHHTNASFATDLSVKKSPGVKGSKDGDLKRERDSDSLDAQSATKKKRLEDVGATIEEPVMLVRGDGSGNDCNTGNSEDIFLNPDSEDIADDLFFGQAIEEPLMFFSGFGSGKECDTGNPGKSSDAANSSEEKNGSTQKVEQTKEENSGKNQGNDPDKDATSTVQERTTAEEKAENLDSKSALSDNELFQESMFKDSLNVKLKKGQLGDASKSSDPCLVAVPGPTPINEKSPSGEGNEGVVESPPNGDNAKTTEAPLPVTKRFLHLSTSPSQSTSFVNSPLQDNAAPTTPLTKSPPKLWTIENICAKPSETSEISPEKSLNLSNTDEADSGDKRGKLQLGVQVLPKSTSPSKRASRWDVGKPGEDEGTRKCSVLDASSEAKCEPGFSPAVRTLFGAKDNVESSELQQKVQASEVVGDSVLGVVPGSAASTTSEQREAELSSALKGKDNISDITAVDKKEDQIEGKVEESKAVKEDEPPQIGFFFGPGCLKFSKPVLTMKKDSKVIQAPKGDTALASINKMPEIASRKLESPTVAINVPVEVVDTKVKEASKLDERSQSQTLPSNNKVDEQKNIAPQIPDLTKETPKTNLEDVEKLTKALTLDRKKVPEKTLLEEAKKIESVPIASPETAQLKKIESTEKSIFSTLSQPVKEPIELKPAMENEPTISSEKKSLDLLQKIVIPEPETHAVADKSKTVEKDATIITPTVSEISCLKDSATKKEEIPLVTKKETTKELLIATAEDSAKKVAAILPSVRPSTHSPEKVTTVKQPVAEVKEIATEAHSEKIPANEVAVKPLECIKDVDRNHSSEKKSSSDATKKLDGPESISVSKKGDTSSKTTLVGKPCKDAEGTLKTSSSETTMSLDKISLHQESVSASKSAIELLTKQAPKISNDKVAMSSSQVSAKSVNQPALQKDSKPVAVATQKEKEVAPVLSHDNKPTKTNTPLPEKVQEVSSSGKVVETEKLPSLKDSPALAMPSKISPQKSSIPPEKSIAAAQVKDSLAIDSASKNAPTSKVTPDKNAPLTKPSTEDSQELPKLNLVPSALAVDKPMVQKEAPKLQIPTAINPSERVLEMSSFDQPSLPSSLKAVKENKETTELSSSTTPVDAKHTEPSVGNISSPAKPNLNPPEETKLSFAGSQTFDNFVEAPPKTNLIVTKSETPRSNDPAPHSNPSQKKISIDTKTGQALPKTQSVEEQLTAKPLKTGVTQEDLSRKAFNKIDVTPAETTKTEIKQEDLLRTKQQPIDECNVQVPKEASKNKVNPPTGEPSNESLLNAKMSKADSFKIESLTVSSSLVEPPKVATRTHKADLTQVELPKDALESYDLFNDKQSEVELPKLETLKGKPSRVVPEIPISELVKTSISKETESISKDHSKTVPLATAPSIAKSTVAATSILEQTKEKSTVLAPAKEQLSKTERIDILKEDLPKQQPTKVEETNVRPLDTELPEAKNITVEVSKVHTEKTEDLKVKPPNEKPSKVEIKTEETPTLQPPIIETLSGGLADVKLSETKDPVVESPKVHPPVSEDQELPPPKEQLTGSEDGKLEPLQVHTAKPEDLKVEHMQMKPSPLKDLTAEPPKVQPANAEDPREQPQSVKHEKEKELSKEPMLDPLVKTESKEDSSKLEPPVEKPAVKTESDVQSKPMKSNASKLREIKKVQKPKSSELEDNTQALNKSASLPLENLEGKVLTEAKSDDFIKGESAILEGGDSIKKDVAEKLDDATQKTETKQASILGLSFDYNPEQSTSKPQQNNRSRRTRTSAADSQDGESGEVDPLGDSTDVLPGRSLRKGTTAPCPRSKRKRRGADDDRPGTPDDQEVAKKKGRGRPARGGSTRKGAAREHVDVSEQSDDAAATADLGVDLVCEESSVESMPSKPKRPSPQKTKSPKKTRKVLGLEIPVEAESPAVDSGTPVRQSRRIAQIKIKEDAERREMEEATRAAIAQEEALSKKKKHKHGSKQASERDSSDQDNENDKDFESGKRKKRKKRKKDWNRRDFDQSNPWRSSSGSSSSMEEEDDEQEQSEEDEPMHRLTDHEFSPESDLEDDSAAQPLRRARTARKESAPPEEPADEADCQKCGKSDHPEWILLCDKCDAGWHCLCLRPALLVIPEGDWFCPPCQHTALIKSLHEQLKAFDGAAKRRENEELRKKRLAYVGISLDNVLPKTDGKEEEGSGAESDGGAGAAADAAAASSRSSSSDGSSSDGDSEPVYQLRERRSAHFSYRFNEYDDLINSAIQDEMEVAKVAGNQGRGKDIGTIIEAEREEEAAAGVVVEKPAEADAEFQPEPEEEEEEEEEDGYIPPVRKSVAKKKHRKLNSLDISSDDENGDSDEDFKGTSSEEEDEDYEEGDTDDSDVGRGRRGRGKSSGPVRRSNRSRVTRFDREFIDDDSDDSDKPARKRKPRNVWDDTSESEESDSTWGRRKKQKQRATRTKAPRSSEKKKKKRRRRATGGSDGETFRASKPKKPRVSFGAPDDLDTVATARRTRGTKINYVEMAGSDSDEEYVKPSKKIIESEDEFVLNEEDEELMDVEDEVKDSENDSADLEEQFGEDSDNDDALPPVVPVVDRKERSKKESKKKKKSEFRARMLQSDNSDEEAEEAAFDETLDTSDPVIDEEALAREEKRLKKEAKKLEKKELKKKGKKKKEELEMSEPTPVVEPVSELPESPTKRKGRGRGKAALAKAAAAEGLPPPPGIAPPAFQPTPAPPAQGHSVISRMLQSQPLPGPLPGAAAGPPPSARSFTDAASAMGQKYFGDRTLGERPPAGDRMGMGERMAMGDRMPPGDRMQMGDRMPPGDRLAMGDRMAPTDRMAMGDRMPPGDRMQMGDRMPPGDRMQMGDRMPPGDRLTMGDRIPPGDRMSMGDRMPPGDRMSMGDRMPMGDRMGPRGLPPSARPPYLPRGRMPLAYRQPRSPAPHFSGPRGPGSHQALYHSAHHPHDPSPSGGGPIAISPSLDKPGHGTPPPAYTRPQAAAMGRFGPDGAPSPNGGVRHPFPAPPGNHMLGRAGTPPGRNPGPGNFSPYHQPAGYHYAGYPGAGPLGPDDPGSYQGAGYPEAYGSSPLAASDGSNSKPMDEEGSGEFGGLVSYFSSQREDDLDA